MKKFLHFKISKDFFCELKKHPAFKNDQNVIAGAYHFLNRINFLSDNNNNNWVSYYNKSVKKYFLNYSDSSKYKIFIDALIELEILEVNRHYVVQTYHTKGECYKYRITDKGVSLIVSCHKELFKNLRKDKNCKKLLKKMKQNRKKDNYADFLKLYILDFLLNLEENEEDLENYLNNLKLTEKQENAIYPALNSLYDKSTVGNNLKNNTSDNRICNEFLLLKSDLKSFFRYKNLPRVAVIDIRSCHPSYWSILLFNHFKDNFNKEYYLFKTYEEIEEYIKDNNKIIKNNTNDNLISNEVLNTNVCIITKGVLSPPPPLLYPLHYGVGKQTSAQKLRSKNGILSGETLQIIKFENLEKEHHEFVKLFTNDLIDPKEVISKQLRIPLFKVKEELTKTINGSNQFPRMKRWLFDTYPNLYCLWRQTDIKDTGCSISRNFETKLMQNEEIYKLGDLLGIKLAYEYDGFSIFSSSTGKELEFEINKIIEKIQDISLKLWDIKPVLKLDILSKV